jgi:hypothetical protein
MRFPEGMRDRIAKLAAENNRSMNAELIDRLEKSMRDEEMMAAHDARMKDWLGRSDRTWKNSWPDSFERIDDRLEKLQATIEVIIAKRKL